MKEILLAEFFQMICRWRRSDGSCQWFWRSSQWWVAHCAWHWWLWHNSCFGGFDCSGRLSWKILLFDSNQFKSIAKHILTAWIIEGFLSKTLGLTAFVLPSFLKICLGGPISSLFLPLYAFMSYLHHEVIFLCSICIWYQYTVYYFPYSNWNLL